jgi:hypothetical protein
MLAAWLHGILNVPRDFLEWPPPAYVLLTDHFASCLGESIYFRSFLPSFLPSWQGPCCLNPQSIPHNSARVIACPGPEFRSWSKFLSHVQ